MINSTSITKTISTAMDIFGLFIESILLVGLETIQFCSYKKPDPLWHNITNNDLPPPPDDDVQGVLRGEILERREEPSSFFEVLRGDLNPCLEQDQEAPPAMNFDFVNDDSQHLQPVLLGSLPSSQ